MKIVGLASAVLVVMVFVVGCPSKQIPSPPPPMIPPPMRMQNPSMMAAQQAMMAAQQDRALEAEAVKKKLKAERAPETPQERIAGAEERQAKALESLLEEERKQTSKIDSIIEWTVPSYAR